MCAQFQERSHLLAEVPHRDIPTFLSNADVSINLSVTGSMDKSVLESLTAGVPAVSSNPAFAEMLSPYGLFIDDESPKNIATILSRATTADIVYLQSMVRSEYSLSTLIPRILKLLQ